LSASTSKKVLIQRFEKEKLFGHLNIAAYLQPRGVEVLTQAGSLVLVPYEDIKSVCFVRDFEDPDPAERKLFTTRPKSAGLWVRMRFRDNDVMDGLLSGNLLTLDTRGFTLTPPDPTSNVQRLFVPRQALAELTVLAVVGSQPRRPAKPAKPAPKEQIKLFD
jgi:hypothetical protein